MKLEYLYWDTNIYNTIAIMFIEWTIKEHSKIATANNYHINVMYKIKWNCERNCGWNPFIWPLPTHHHHNGESWWCMW